MAETEGLAHGPKDRVQSSGNLLRRRKCVGANLDLFDQILDRDREVVASSLLDEPPKLGSGGKR